MYFLETIKFEFKGKQYQMFVNKKGSKFFMEVLDNGSYNYISLKTLIELRDKFVNYPLELAIEKIENNDYPLNENIDTIDTIDTQKNNTTAKKKSKKIIPKVLIKGSAITLSISLLIAGIITYSKYKYTNINDLLNDTNIAYLDESQEELEENWDVELDTYYKSDMLKYLYIYDSENLNLAFSQETITQDMLDKTIDENNSIPSYYKMLLHEYVNAISTKYPNVNLQIFYENLKTLKIVELNEVDLIGKTMSGSASGCYYKNENAIYVMKGKKYQKQTWDYQVMFHELSHCARGKWYTDKNGYDVHIQFEGRNVSNTIVAEAMNSLFAVSLFDYEEKDIAYQLQSNYFKVLLECLDNYSLEDYMNHSLSYLALKMDEKNKDMTPALKVFNIIESQYTTYHDIGYEDNVVVNPKEYNEAYEYLAELYCRKYINENMSPDEVNKLINDLKEIIKFDVPAEYKIEENLDTMSNYIIEYAKNLGIEMNSNLSL